MLKRESRTSLGKLFNVILLAGGLLYLSENPALQAQTDGCLACDDTYTSCLRTCDQTNPPSTNPSGYSACRGECDYNYTQCFLDCMESGGTGGGGGGESCSRVCRDLFVDCQHEGVSFSTCYAAYNNCKGHCYGG